MKLDSFYILLDEVYDRGDIYGGGLYIHKEAFQLMAYRKWALNELRNHLNRYLSHTEDLSLDTLSTEVTNFLIIMKRCKRKMAGTLKMKMFDEAVDVTLDILDLIRCCMPE